VLDLKQDSDKEVLGALVERADIFVHNLAPGAVDRLGLGYDALAKRHARLIWCGISGYGPDGPYRDKKAYDLLLQAEAGVIGVTGEPDAPAKVGVSIADISAGHYAYSSILAALLNRARTGRGERIDISMLECLTEAMMPVLYSWLGTGTIPARAGLRHNLIVPYGVYACADGAVNLAIQNDREWQRFCAEILAQPAVAVDPRFATNAARVRHRQELEDLIERRFADLQAEAIVDLLDRAGIANSRVNDVPAVVAHPQLAARARWVEVESPVGRIPALLPPHNLQGTPVAMGRVPALGEHTAVVFEELGIVLPRVGGPDDAG